MLAIDFTTTYERVKSLFAIMFILIYVAKNNYSNRIR